MRTLDELKQSCIDMMGNAEWSEADIMANGRALIDAEVSAERRSELQTIMLGHMSGMRVATPGELAEIANVQAVMEAVTLGNEAARKDMALLAEVLRVERGELPLADASEAALVLHALRHPVVPSEVTNAV